MFNEKWVKIERWISKAPHTTLEHLHPAAERQALEKPFEGLEACNQNFYRGTPPPLSTSFLFI